MTTEQLGRTDQLLTGIECINEALVLSGEFDYAITILGDYFLDVNEIPASETTEVALTGLRASVYRARGMARLRQALHPNTSAETRQLGWREGFFDLRNSIRLNSQQLVDESGGVSTRLALAQGRSINCMARLLTARLLTNQGPDEGSVPLVTSADWPLDQFRQAETYFASSGNEYERVFNACTALVAGVGLGELRTAIDQVNFLESGFTPSRHTCNDMNDLRRAQEVAECVVPSRVSQQAAIGRLTNWLTV